MKLEVNIYKKMPDFTIDVSFCCKAGEMQILTGPSGSGKTTIIRILAGLEKADHGLIRFDDTVWEDTAERIFLPPQQREVGYVFQEYSLFPHLTTEQNVGFAAAEPENVEQYMRFLGITHLAGRFPKQLSGGERQRVALAQALARKPRAMLLDEPFSALDFITREKLRNSLHELKNLVNIPIIHITHDLHEGLQMADSFLPLEKGRISHSWLPEAVREKLPDYQAGICRREAQRIPVGAKGPVKVSALNRLFGYSRTCNP